MEVYCETCKYFKWEKYGSLCSHDDNAIISRTPVSKNIEYGICVYVNRGNKCTLYKQATLYKIIYFIRDIFKKENIT